MTKGKARNLILFGFIFLILPLIFSVLNLYTDWLFFTETGYTSVFIKTLSTKISTGIFFGIAFLAFVLANITIANRANFPQREISVIEGVINPFIAGGIEKVIKPLTIIAGVVMAIFAAQWGALRWEDFLLFKNSLDMGTNDPLLAKDIGFYLFKLPFIESLNGFAGFTLLLTIIAVAANYFLRGGIFIAERIISVDGKVKKHLGILAGLVILNIGFGFYLDTFRLLFSEHGAIFGAGHTDVHAKLFFYRILIFITPLAGIVFMAGILRGSRRLTFLPPVLVSAVYIIGIVAYPYVLQKFKVAPNELALETPFIEQNIKFTRLGYNLDKIDVRPFDVDYNLSGKDIEKNDATIKNIRLWDHSPLLRTYSQLQQIRTYYKFADVDNDRYTINGEYMQVMLSPRELSYNDLPSKTWINERLIFTHGNGITLGPVSRITREGLPEFIMKDIPPVSQVDLRVTRPEIYYGELSNNYVIVKTKVPEFSYPTSEGNVYTTYDGSGGVRLDSLFKRALFSVKFKTEKILLSSDISGESKILYYRNIMDRVRAVAPFLLFDQDPYMIVTKDGRLVWIADAYTVSSRMPYSKPTDRRINYIRNSVKVVIDAYNGSMGFYVSDPSDILIKVYSKIFPDIFKSLKEMPEELRQHIRYPHRLLQIQASMFAAYHMTDAKVFYNKENLWEVPAFGDMLMEPYYTIMKLPGEKKEEYILLLPYTPAKRDNLAAWLAARCDEPDYGELLIYTFPRDRLIFGPKQVDARINQDSYISQQLTLWGQRGSEVIRGSLLVIPIERSLLYVQPLYLAAADKVGLPELRRVIVAYENDVVMEENLELALQRLFGAKAIAGKADRAVADIKSTTSDLAKEAMRVFERAIELQRQGNWAGYGEEIRKLEQLLKRIAK
ncbi:MAG: UPF0182 family protein [Nitrospira sp.]|nr:UPF0182 family protein [Nitrospira sp.]